MTRSPKRQGIAARSIGFAKWTECLVERLERSNDLQPVAFEALLKMGLSRSAFCGTLGGAYRLPFATTNRDPFRKRRWTRNVFAGGILLGLHVGFAALRLLLLLVLWIDP